MNEALKIERCTPVLIVDAIEPLLPLYRDALGFTVAAEVEHESKVGFVLLVRDDVHLMLQTKASVADDLPAVGALGVTSSLYVDVNDVDAFARAAKGTKVLAGPRTTFYGSREIVLETASGHVIAFAEPAKK